MKNNIIPIISGLRWSSTVAALIFGILLVATLIQTKLHNPITTGNFSNIYRLADKNPSDSSLKNEIRTLDMLARKAYFTSIHQLKIGTVLLIVAVSISLILWYVQISMEPQRSVAPPQKMSSNKKLSMWNRQTQSAKTTAIVCAVFVAIIFFYGIAQKYSTKTSIFAITSNRNAILESQQFSQWWMNFRGPGGYGVATAYANIPVKFDAESMSNIRWKVEIPIEGRSSPIVYQNLIFLTGGTKDVRQVYCFDANYGKSIWTRDVKVSGIENQQMPKVDKETGYAAPTMACDGKFVYAIFATGEVVAFTLKGKPIWSKFLGIPDNHYGHSSSLITHNGLLLIQFDQYDVGKLLAIEGKSGKSIWEVKRPILSWGSPIIVNVGDYFELILVDNEFVSSYDPNNGNLLWSVDCMHGEVGPSAAFASGSVFAANEYAVAAGISIANNNQDSVSGRNNDTCAIIWEWRGDLPNTSSPVSVDSILILATSSGIVTCLDNRNGSVFWRHEFERGFYSSPIIADGKVFLFDRDGVMRVFLASPNFTLLESSNIGEPVVATQAMLNGYMIVRGEKYLYRIDGSNTTN